MIWKLEPETRPPFMSEKGQKSWQDKDLFLSASITFPCPNVATQLMPGMTDQMDLTQR